MNKILELKADDPILNQLDFKTYRYTTKRSAEQFLPAHDQPQTIKVKTSWGGVLTGKRGDYLVSECDDPEELWIVDKEIFESTYEKVIPGIYKITGTVELVPLTHITHDPDQKLTIHSLEGPLTVRAGDFYLARGANGEIWPKPNKGAGNLELVE